MVRKFTWDVCLHNAEVTEPESVAVSLINHGEINKQAEKSSTSCRLIVAKAVVLLLLLNVIKWWCTVYALNYFHILNNYYYQVD